MKLNHFTIYKNGYSETIEILVKLKTILTLDNNWYFIPNPKGTLLRVSPSSAKAIRRELSKLLGNEEWLEEKSFEPTEDEHWHARFVGDDLTVIFHDVSLLALKYPREVMKVIFERMCHIFMFQIGIMDWKEEAKILSQLALRRAELYGRHGYTTTEWHD